MGSIGTREGRSAFRKLIQDSVPVEFQTRVMQLMESVVFSVEPILRGLEYLEVRNGSGAPVPGDYPDDGFGIWIDDAGGQAYVVLKWLGSFFIVGGSGGGSLPAHTHLVADVTDFDPNDYLLLAGGTMTGNIIFEDNLGIWATVLGNTRRLIGTTTDTEVVEVGDLNNDWPLALYGADTRPTYDDGGGVEDLALFSDIAAALAGYLPLAGGTMVGDVIYQEPAGVYFKGIAPGPNYVGLLLTGSNFAVGDTLTNLRLQGAETRPQYNGNDLALYSDLTTALLDYVKRDGTTPLTGAWDVGNFDITNIDNLDVNANVDVGNELDVVGDAIVRATVRTSDIDTIANDDLTFFRDGGVFMTFLSLDDTIQIEKLLFPGTNAAIDLGKDGNNFRTLYLQNNNGRVLDCADTADVGATTAYEFYLGGGGAGSSEAVFQFGPQTPGLGDNNFIIDYGPVDFATRVHTYVFRSTGNSPVIGDISVETEFGGALGPGNIGIKFENTGTFNYQNIIDCNMGETLAAGFDVTVGDRWRKRYMVRIDGFEQYTLNRQNRQSWHCFDMQPTAMSPGSASYSLMRILALNDTLTANRTIRAGLRIDAPTPTLGAFTLTNAANLHINGQPAVGTTPAGILMTNSARLVMTNAGSGTGPAFSGVGNFGGIDIILELPTTPAASLWHVLYPNSGSPAIHASYVNDPNLFLGTYAFLDVGVTGALAYLLCKESAAPTPITDLDIGGDATSALADINFKFANVTRVNFTATTVVMADAQDFVFNTATGTKIGTATNQKLAFYNSTPIVQPGATGAGGHTAVGGANVQVNDTFTGGAGATAYTIGDVVAALKNLGLIAA